MGACLGAFLAACSCFFIMMPTLSPTRCGLSFAGAPAAAQEVHRSWPDRPVEKLVVGATMAAWLGPSVWDHGVHQWK